jgi:hypothetical protein
MSFETFLRQSNLTEKAIATATVWTHAMLGVDPSEVSALYFIECKWYYFFEPVQALMRDLQTVPPAEGS